MVAVVIPPLLAPLRRLRLARGLSQADLARRVGMRPATISAIETGKTCPRPRTLRRLANGLGVGPDVLFTTAPAPGDA
jgi:TetR/AcrR family transcriptional regulator, cholesterol catabolism regulator